MLNVHYPSLPLYPLGMLSNLMCITGVYDKLKYVYAVYTVLIAGDNTVYPNLVQPVPTGLQATDPVIVHIE